MDKNTERLFEINNRKAEIRSQIEANTIENLDEVEVELRGLETEYTNIEKRMRIVDGIVVGKPEGEIKMEKREFTIESAEYRSAFLNNLRGVELNEIEKRALSTAIDSAGSVIPTTTTNKIVEKVKQYAPMLSKIELLNIKGNVTVPTEGTTVDAQLHLEGAIITDDNDKLGKVALSGYEITKLVTISKSVETMPIDAFENWLTNKIAKKVAEKISALIINGTGTNQAQGINAITWDAKNSVTVAKAGSLSEANVTGVVSLLGGGYLENAEWLMSSTTFFSDFYPLMNNSKNNVVTETNGIYRVMGKIVTFDDRITLHEAILGSIYDGYIGNLQEDVNITSQFVTRENSYDFLGCAIFDGKVQAVEAFVKIVKAIV